MSTTSTDAKRTSGVIQAEALYTLPEIKARLGLGRDALRTARGKGLIVRKIGVREFILGRDVMNYVEAAGVRVS